MTKKNIANGSLHSIRRRDLIAMLGVAAPLALAWPSMGEQSAAPVIGRLILNPPDDPASGVFNRAWNKGLEGEGFIVGHNVKFDTRWPEGHMERIPSLITSLVNEHVAVLVPLTGVAGIKAAIEATRTIPIVFVDAGDPVEHGLVSSFTGPNGNVTGIALLQNYTTLKEIEALNELLPGNKPLGLLVDPNMEIGEEIQHSNPPPAVRFGRPFQVFRAASVSEFDAAFRAAKEQGIAGIVIPGGPLYDTYHTQLAALAAQYRMPAIYPNGDLAASGGLMMYGAEPEEAIRLLADYVGRILKGTKPAELPVLQTPNVILKINLKTAKALGLTVPTSLLVRADEVIE